MRKKRKSGWLSFYAISILAGLETYALHLGINGIMFSMVTMAIAGIAGFELRGLIR